MSQSVHAATPESVLKHYADMAHVKYDDALLTAETLEQKIDIFLAEPTEENLAASKAAWVAARVPYMQTEAYRFGNAIVDAWEGKVNSWPLDEGLIDYTASSYGVDSEENPFYTANIVANKKLAVGGTEIDASKITKQLLTDTLHEIDDVEANVATGYHAIEFLLWGQDLNGTNAGAGQRPASDYDHEDCSGGYCDRRADYLKAVTELLIDDLKWMVNQWSEDGDARVAIVSGNLNKNIATIFTGMGSLSYGELAGERMKLGLMLHDPEEEHDCFSDNTHYSHYYDVVGIRNVYTGTYIRIDGSEVKGPSLSDLVVAKDVDADKNLREHIDASIAKMQILVDTAEAGEAYDQMLAEDNESGNAKIRAAVDALVAQTSFIEKAVSVMNLESIAFEGSDSLDAPEIVN
ncbi:MAG: imelysin family protein [Gammaproteobacteria bacterium]